MPFTDTTWRFLKITNGLQHNRPDVIIHTAADRNPSSFQQNHSSQKDLDVNNNNDKKVLASTSPSWHLNAITPGRLARQHIKYCNSDDSADGRTTEMPPTLFIYISTDYVFPGTPPPSVSTGSVPSSDSREVQKGSDTDTGGPPYKPDAKTRPLNLYGESKRAGELAVLKVAAEEDEKLSKGDRTPNTALNRNRFLILRIPLLYGHIESSESPVQKGAVGVLVETVLEASKRKGQWEREMRKWRKARDSCNEGNHASDSILQESSALEKTVVDNWARRYPTCVEDVACILLALADFFLGHKDAEDEGNNKDNGNHDNTANQNSTSGTNLPRILHFTAEQRFTKYDICQIFADILGLNVDDALVPDDGDDDASQLISKTAMSIQRPYDTQLDVSETRRVLQQARARSRITATDSDNILENVDFKEWWYV